VDNTDKTKRPQPRSNTKNDRAPSASKSSCNKNKEVEVKEPYRNLLLSKNKKHMSSKCNNVKLAIRNDKSKVVCAMCKKCLITVNHDVCVLNYVNDMNSHDTGKLGAKGDIGFFVGYSADSCAYRVYNRRTKKIMETMNVTFVELSAMAFEQSSSKPRLKA
nr:integrase, catalytic region, zinc finger, CCHC-type, peptidase aspartic, catalytic [Tanacetum cinerariifolium]